MTQNLDCVIVKVTFYADCEKPTRKNSVIDPTCEKTTVIDETTGGVSYVSQVVNPEPNFSVEVFFDFLGGMMALSTLSFLLMNVMPSLRDEHASKHQVWPVH